MASDREVRKFVRQWRKRYPMPVDWADDRANKQYRRSESAWLAQFLGASVLKRRQVNALIQWRFADQADLRAQALHGIDGPAAWGHARRCIKKALAEASSTGALDHLLGEHGGVPGWGPAMASVVLAACRPHTYTVADRRAVRSLVALGRFSPHSGGEFVRADWYPYLSACREIAEICGVPLRTVDQALWAGADAAPELPKKPG